MSKEYRQNTKYEQILYEDKKGRWVTIKGTPIFIKNGQTIEDAIEEFRNRQKEKNKNRLRNEKRIVQSCVFDKISTVRGILEAKGFAFVKISTALYRYEICIYNNDKYSYRVIKKWKLK